MALQTRIVVICLSLSVAVFGIYRVTDRSIVRSEANPVVLTVMGKVADLGDSAEQKAYREFSAKTGVVIRFFQSKQSINSRVDFILDLFRAHSAEPDLIEMDVILPTALGSHLVDLTPLLGSEIAAFAPELLRNYTVNGRLIAIPTFIDAGVLYYRPDLLRKYGFSKPPKTWEELERMAVRIQSGERRAGNVDFWGYLWQGGAYESLTCNALEWQASSGSGQILGTDQTVRVRTPKFLQALRRAVSWIGTISPPGQSAYTEDDSANFWLAGKAAFMRGWNGQYFALLHSASPTHDLIEIAALPGGEGGRAGTLGGSGTGISKYSAHPRQALEALKYIIREETQRDRAITGGYVPSRTALRRDVAVMLHTPLHGNVAGDVMENLAARPALQAGGSYSSVSRAYYTAIHSILVRQVTPEEGLARLETDLVKITGFRAHP